MGADASGERLRRALPVLRWLPRYRRRFLAGDVLAGLVVAALAIPQSLGYATIAGVPIIVGLYSIPFALLAYAIFGSSPHLVVGPVSTVSVLSGALVADMAGGDAAQAVALTSALAIGAGVGLIVGGVARVGWAAEFLSRPIVTGFVFGLVLLIVVGEIPSLLGMPATSGDVPARVVQVASSLEDISVPTAVIGAVCLAVLFLGARFASRVPWALLVVLAAIAMSAVLGWQDAGVVTVGAVPQGLPPLGLPGIDGEQIPAVVSGGLALALVGLAEGLGAARIFAAREGYRIDTDQEMIGSGVANLAAGVSGGMGVAGSLSKTAASRSAGGRTQVTGLFAAAVVLLVVVLLADYLAPLPRAVLSAVVIQAVWGLMDIGAIRRYAFIRRNDFVSALAAMVGVLLVGPLYGLLIAVALAVLGLVYRSSRADLEVMGKVPDEKAAWGSIRNHPERLTYDGIMVIRLDAPLFWANAAEITDRVLEQVDTAPTLQALVLDLEATSQLDTTSLDSLESLLERLRERDIDLYLVRVFFSARKILARSGFVKELGADHMWHSISAGVRAARKDAHLRGGFHTQFDDDDDDAEDRIAVDHRRNGDDDGPGGEAPRGGYQDPFPSARSRLWRRGI